MLKVVGNAYAFLTADSTLITADNLTWEISADSGYDNTTLRVPCRFFSTDIDFRIIEELTDNVQIFDSIPIDNGDGTLSITFSYGFKEGRTYEFNIKSNNILISKGKIFSTDETDLENYVINKPDDNGIIKI